MSSFSTCKKCFLFEVCGGCTDATGTFTLLPCTEIFPPPDGFINPSKLRDFCRRLAEVRFHDPLCQKPFIAAPVDRFPEYITKIHGGVYFENPVAPKIAALGLIEIFQGNEKGVQFGEQELSAASIRKRWGLAPDAEILLSGVANDTALERLWENYKLRNIPSQIASLNVIGVTAPNFTFWKEEARMQNIFNRVRMLRFCEELTSVGVAAIPHINSTHQLDWDWWKGFMREHPELNSIAMEFRTGNAVDGVRQFKINALYEMQQSLGRELHPIIIGNIKAAGEIRRLFPKMTAIDSTPASKTTKRQRAQMNLHRAMRWSPSPLAPRTCMSELFNFNYQIHYQHVMRRLVKNENLTDKAEIRGGDVQKVQPRMLSIKTSQPLQGELQLEAA